MKTTLSFIAVALSLAACDVVETAAVDTGREAAKAVVAPIVADTVPGPAGVVLTNCIIDNASGEELFTLGVQGATPENITLVSNILARPETVSCATSALT
ncbi:succinate dehydrogenase [Octadecabacter sp. G9-8]|uniref:Succinate dehydrogenase n=1 Tax=Octadecabacter dasysiphoniae TaxID=2909341 RepID=A0ABS9CQU5_9RHOB|nr:succinate dehydrogenase [Octadecabacter dasysiphoniae]MCF2869600.1 succinate dehydrogenase [Octadecabacter dasysiphoniae]